MRTSRPCFGIPSYTFAALGAVALFGTTAQAADLVPTALPPLPAETWTGFSVGVGGGVAFLDANVNAKASRDDEIREECLPFVDLTPQPPLPCSPAGTQIDLLSVKQSFTSNVDNLSDTGGFITVQGTYDYQFAPRWVVGAFVDADWSDLDAHARQTHKSSQNASSLTIAQDLLFGFAVGDQKTTVDAEVSADWSISVGGRMGWLANPSTLLYFLAAYTHQDLNDARVRISIADPIQVFGSSPNGEFHNNPTNFLIRLPDSLDGFSLGGGGEVKLGGPWTLKGEYRWTHLDGGSGRRASSSELQSVVVATGCTGSADGSPCTQLLDTHSSKSRASADLDDIDLHTVRAVLTYHFWTGGGYGG